MRLLKTAFLCIVISASMPAHSQQTTTLSDVLRHVKHTHPALKAADAELDATRETLDQAYAGWKPTISAEASIFSSDIENSNFNNGTGATTKDLTLSLEQPLFRGGRTWAEMARAENIIKSGEAVAHSIYQSIYLDAVTAYMDVFRDRMLVDVLERNQSILNGEYTSIFERFKGGDATRTDVDQARARLNRSQSEKAAALGRLAASEARFENTIGMAAPQNLAYPYDSLPIPDKLGDIRSALDVYNPDIRAAFYAKKAAKENSKAVFRELFPQLFAFANHNKQYDPQPGIVDQTEVSTIGMRLTVPLYQAGATRSRARQAKQTAYQRKWEVEDIKRDTIARVSSNWALLQSTRKEMNLRAEEARMAKAVRKGITEQARLGERTTTDVLDAERDTLDAERALINTYRDEVIYLYRLAADLNAISPRPVKQDKQP